MEEEVEVEEEEDDERTRGRWRWVFGNAKTKKQIEGNSTEDGFNFWGRQIVTSTRRCWNGRKDTDGEENERETKRNERLENDVRGVGWFDILLHGADRGDVALIVVGTFAAITNGAALPVATIFLGDALNAYNNGSVAMQSGSLPPGLEASGSGMLTLVGEQSLNLIYVGVAGMVAGALHMFCWMSVCERISAHIRVSYVRALLSQEIAFYDKEVPRELVARLTQDVNLVSNAIGEKVGMLLENMSSFVAGIVIGFVRGPLLALVISACIPALALAAAMMSVLLQSIEKTKKDVYSHGDGIARECLAAIRTVMAFTAEDRSYTRYNHVLSTKTTRMVIRAGFIQGFGMGLVMFVLFSMYAVAMWFGSVQIINADYTGGQVLTVFFSILIGGFSLGQGAPNFAAVSKGVGGAAKIFEIIRREPEMDVTGSSGKAISTAEEVRSIVFESISFAYPTRIDLPIFTNLSMTLATGKTTAIVGSSGSGKSTLLALLQRFYDPLEGRIMINGTCLTELNLSDLRRNVFGFVSQDTVLFGTLSLYDNIRMGIAGSSNAAAAAAAAAAITTTAAADTDGETDDVDGEEETEEEEESRTGAKKMSMMWRGFKKKKTTEAMVTKDNPAQFSDDDPIVKAARSAFADEFIRKLPEGYATLVGEGGSKISGGQRQRISIARAMLKRAPILLLDEATSALDAESEQVVQEALDNYSSHGGGDERATIVIVAHRLSTIRNADVVVVLDRALNTVGDGTEGDNDDDHYNDGTSTRAPLRTSAGSYVAESGTHDELMAKENGVYRQLVSLQTSAKTEVDDGSSDDAPQYHSPSSMCNKSRMNTQEQQTVEALPAPSSPADDSADYPVDTAIKQKGDDETDATDTEDAAQGEGASTEETDEDDDTAIEQKSSFYQNAYRIFLISRPDWLFMIIGAISCGIFGAVWPLLGLVLAEILDVFYLTDYDQLEKDARFWSIIFVVLAIVNFLCSTVQQTAFAIVAARLSTRLRSVMFNSALSQELGWHDADVNNSSAVAMRLGGDAEIVAGFLQSQLGMFIQNIVTLVLGLVLAFVFAWELTLVVIGLVPLMGLAGYFQFKALSGYSGNTRPLYEDAAVMTSDAVDSIRTVASYTLEEYMTTSYAMRLLLPLQAGRRAAIISGLSHGSSFFLTIGPMALSFYIGAVFVNDGLISFRDVMIVVFVLLYASQGASQAQAAVPDAGRLDYAMKSVFELMDREPRIDSRSRAEDVHDNDDDGDDGEEADDIHHEEDDSAGQKIVVVRGGKTPAPTSESGFDILLDSIRFSYPTRPEAVIFGDLSLRIEPGCFAAVVGESGSGKSTLLSLLLRFYDVDAGQVCIDGCDIREINLRWLRSQIAYVQQEPVLFDTTILENIQYGNEECTEEDAIAAARNANAHTFVESFPDAYNTVVGERGMQLSGGQKQRIAIARAIVRKPKLLLLDEATSALDAESEHLVQDALERFRQERSTVIVAHRLSTVRQADSIAVLKRDLGAALGDPDDKGSYVAECGSHDELMAKENGTYRGLVRLQDIAAQTV